jgi:ferredoxin
MVSELRKASAEAASAAVAAAQAAGVLAAIAKAAAEAAGVVLPSSCCSGVCTTCAALLSAGSVEQADAMGVKAELQQQGYVLLCVAFPRSDLTLRAGMEDALYEAQFGQYQK